MNSKLTAIYEIGNIKIRKNITIIRKLYSIITRVKKVSIVYGLINYFLNKCIHYQIPSYKIKKIKLMLPPHSKTIKPSKYLLINIYHMNINELITEINNYTK